MTSKLYINKVRTYITCNFKEGAYGDVELALLEFRDKYGNRVYDRLFELFNIVMFEVKALGNRVFVIFLNYLLYLI